ncbi:MAG: hypothetical protein ACLVI5_13180, partial [Desulfovibrio piger]
MSAKRQRPVNIADLSVKLLKGMTAARGTQALPATAGSRLFFFTGSSILAQTQRQKFLEGRGAGRENLFSADCQMNCTASRIPFSRS